VKVLPAGGADSAPASQKSPVLRSRSAVLTLFLVNETRTLHQNAEGGYAALRVLAIEPNA